MVDVRKRLVKALHSSATLAELRTELVLVVCDLDEAQNAAPTLRSIATDASVRNGGREDEAPDTEHDSAPSWPVDSELGKEYGV